MWRFQTRSRRGERQDDDWTHRAIGCVKAIHREACGYRPYRQDPDLMQARELAQHQDWRRAELESRVLADQPIGEISSALGLSASVIFAFETLFFDVRPRLGVQGWIIYSVIGLRPWGPLELHDVAAALKYYGFMFGACVLDALLAGADREDLERFGLPVFWSELSRLPKEFQFSLLARSLPQHDRKALRSLTRFVGLGLCEIPSRVMPPPKELSLELSGDIESGLASWDEQADTCEAAAEGREAQAA